MKYVCNVCGWIYDETEGYPAGGIAPGTKWEDVSKDFRCPLCSVGKDSFAVADSGAASGAENGGIKSVLMIVGSLRRDSFNHQLALQVQEMMKEQVEVRFLEFADVPFMNQDIEFPAPASVARVRQAVQEAEGIWIFSPEYNGQIPGVLKNLLDWLSRPLIPGDPQRISAVRGKVVTISSVAGKSAGAGVRNHLSSLLERMSMKLIGGTGTGISLDGEAFRTNQLTLSEENKEELRRQAERFLRA